jgi:hypothetical protein
MNKENKFKNLFESTADEMFYDFVKKHNKKIISIIISIFLIIILMTINYSNNEKLNSKIACRLHNLINKTTKGENCNKEIDELIIETKTSKISDILRLDRKKISYRATLLLLKDVSNFTKEEFAAYVKEVEALPYVCQYISTIEHFKRFSFSGELLFFKVIENMCRYNYKEEDILTFFMIKKLHASILKGHMYAFLGIINKNPYILSDLLSSANLMDNVSIQNIPQIFLTLIDTHKEDINKKDTHKEIQKKDINKEHQKKNIKIKKKGKVVNEK